MSAPAPLFATFWVWWRGRYVGIFLTEDDPVWEDSFSHSTDEGFHSEWCRYSLCTDEAEPYVLCEEGSDGRDCDGPLSTGHDYVCPLSDLAAGQTMLIGYGKDDPNQCFYSDHHRMPKWQERDAWQRDVFAESAGY